MSMSYSENKRITDLEALVTALQDRVAALEEKTNSRRTITGKSIRLTEPIQIPETL